MSIYHHISCKLLNFFHMIYMGLVSLLITSTITWSFTILPYTNNALLHNMQKILYFKKIYIFLIVWFKIFRDLVSIYRHISYKSLNFFHIIYVELISLLITSTIIWSFTILSCTNNILRHSSIIAPGPCLFPICD